MFHYVTLNVKELTKSYQGCSQIDAKTGQPVEFRHPRRPDTHYFWPLCPNHPKIRSAHRTKLVRFFRETSMDGFFTDLIWRAPNACVCEHCRARFKREREPWVRS